MPAAERPEFTIVGAGLAGALMACYLGKAGRRVDLYDRRPDPRAGAPDQGEAVTVTGARAPHPRGRPRLQKRDRFDYSQEYLSHGYKELTLPPAPDGGFRMEKHALHIWPRHSFMMIALPNRDGSFTCTLFWPYDGPNSFAQVQTEADLHRVFAPYFPDALPLTPALAADYFANPDGPPLTAPS